MNQAAPRLQSMYGGEISPAVAMAEEGRAPEVAVVIPCYGYASFMPEFMQGLLAQLGDVPFRCIIVDDGDPDPMMRETARTYAAAYPQFIHYHRPRHNGGLSAARNAGVTYALDNWPTARMVMFPDADDRMAADYIRNSHTAFVEAEERAVRDGRKLGWVFEHPVMIGVRGEMPRITKHSVLWNLVGATQMPSSALSMQMFREGLRYDESLKWAGEDWAFSVSALAAGFVAEYCGRQGFLWRRRPGSMSAAHGATMAREHNRTWIRLNNKKLFSYEAVMKRLEAENPHYCICSREKLYLATSPEEMTRAFDGSATPLSIADLGKMLNRHRESLADPCPQSYMFSPGGMPDGFAQSAMFAFFTLISDFYAGSGMAVCHRFHHTDAPGTQPMLSGASMGRPNHSDVFVISEAQLSGLLAHQPIESLKFLTLDWAVPRRGQTTKRGTGALMETLRVVKALNETGYDFVHPVARDARQSWKPMNLDWRQLPGFLLGTRGVFPGGDDKDAHLVVCNVSQIQGVLDALGEAGTGAVDLMTLGNTTDTAEALVAGAVDGGQVRRYFPANSALLSTGPSRDFWQTEPMTRVLLSYGRVTFWRNMHFADKLASLKTSGAQREILFEDADDISAVLVSISSAFKCYDVYRVLSDADGRGSAVLNAFGIADEMIQVGL